MESWIQDLYNGDQKCVVMLLYYVLAKELSFTETRAAKLTAKNFPKKHTRKQFEFDA